MTATIDAPKPKVRYRPYGAAERVWISKDREVVCDGPSRTGKTRGLLEKGLLAAMKYPGARVLLIRKSRASMSETVLQTFEDHVLPEPCLWKGEASRGFREKYTLPNGSEIITGGMDHTLKIMSSEYDLILAFESTEFAEGDIELLTTRLSNGRMPYQQIILDCNPAGPNHWILKRVESGRMVRFPSTHKDNPRWWNGKDWTPEGLAYLAGLESLTGARKQRLMYGKWVSAEGIVYTEFDAHTHIIDAMPAGWESWPKYRAIDFGFNDPFVCLWGAVCDDAVYIYREWYRSGMIVEDHAAKIKALSAGEVYESTFADHDREDRETLHRHGVNTIPAVKDIDTGINEVKARLTPGTNGRPRLFILRTALVEVDHNLADKHRPTGIIEEMDCYSWKQHRDGNSKDEPIDKDNHAVDACRYLCMGLGGGGSVVIYSGGGDELTADDRFWSSV